MIQLTRLNHVPLIVNSDLIEHVEVTPDTVIALTTGQKFLVLESAEEVVERVIQFRRAVVSEHGCPLKKDGRFVAGDSISASSGAPASSGAGGQ
jgi:flagellar protein FlbD